MCVRRSGNILFYFFAGNFTGSKDTEPYKTDVSFFVSAYVFGRGELCSTFPIKKLWVEIEIEYGLHLTPIWVFMHIKLLTEANFHCKKTGFVFQNGNLVPSNSPWKKEIPCSTVLTYSIVASELKQYI